MWFIRLFDRINVNPEMPFGPDGCSTELAGYFADKEEALTAVRENWEYLDDCAYHYAMVAFIPEGIISIEDMETEQWFEFDNKTGTWHPLEGGRPKVFEHTAFSIT